jgi:hypothetical protein
MEEKKKKKKERGTEDRGNEVEEEKCKHLKTGRRKRQPTLPSLLLW